MSRHPTRTIRERAARRYYLRWAGRARAGHGSYRVGPAVLDRLAAPRERRLIREMDAALARVESLEADWHACRDAFHMASRGTARRPGRRSPTSRRTAMSDATAAPTCSVTVPVELTPAGEALLSSLCPPAPEGLTAEQEINKAAELLTVRAGYAAHLAATGMWASAAEYARSAARHAAHLHALTSAAAGCQPADPPDQEVP